MKANKKSVIITLDTVEIQCTSITSAATEMGVSYQSISRLVNKRAKKSKGKGGDYSGQFFTARFRDE